jgi:hypothetical protein
MISYTEQMALCRKIREKLIRALSEREDRSIMPLAHYIPTTEAVLRAVTLAPEFPFLALRPRACAAALVPPFPFMMLLTTPFFGSTLRPHSRPDRRSRGRLPFRQPFPPGHSLFLPRRVRTGLAGRVC